ncbi:MAG: bifunctional riboflavin kinase/FAD synthetase [Flavobacteriaceae bacterium]|nr:bifunctional riboflavin kinase/FAD synthetase [Flavobacteriaceae bacterium]
MREIKGIDNFSSECPTIVTIGTFDGVHKGHQKILKKLTSEAKKYNLKSVVLTFFPHPRTVLNPKFPLKLINTIEERIELVSKSNVDFIIIHPFDKSFSDLHPEEFVESLLVKKLNIKKILIGYDHRFGKDRKAGIKDLELFGSKYNFDVLEIGVKEVNNISISSTKIRNSIIEGDFNKVYSFLGYDLMISGKVIKGNAIGRTIGFPTANLKIDNDYKLTPKNGVYLITAILDKKKYYGMMNIGIKPTLNKKKQSIEVNFFELKKDLYEKIITVFMLQFIRNEIKFNSLEDLKNQIRIDKKTCETLINKVN